MEQMKKKYVIAKENYENNKITIWDIKLELQTINNMIQYLKKTIPNFNIIQVETIIDNLKNEINKVNQLNQNDINIITEQMNRIYNIFEKINFPKPDFNFWRNNYNPGIDDKLISETIMEMSDIWNFNLVFARNIQNASDKDYDNYKYSGSMITNSCTLDTDNTKWCMLNILFNTLTQKYSTYENNGLYFDIYPSNTNSIKGLNESKINGLNLIIMLDVFYNIINGIDFYSLNLNQNEFKNIITKGNSSFKQTFEKYIDEKETLIGWDVFKTVFQILYIQFENKGYFIQQNALQNNKLQVQIPQGIFPGQQFNVKGVNGSLINVTVPQGSKPGDIIIVDGTNDENRQYGGIFIK